MSRTRMTPNRKQEQLLAALARKGEKIDALRQKILNEEAFRDAQIEAGRQMGLPVSMLTEHAGMARETYYTRRKKVRT